jgi:hypothetical protein
MNDVFWFQGKLLSIEDGVFKHWEKYLPLPLKSVAEIHYNSLVESKSIVFPQENIKYWVSPNAFFDTTLLLINRMLGTNLESMLIFEEINNTVVFGLFGKAALVGRYNLPPEFEIHTSGWLSLATFSDWLNKSEPKPQIITVETNKDPSDPLTNETKASSLLHAFLIAKEKPQALASWLFNSPNENTNAYLTIERI